VLFVVPNGAVLPVVGRSPAGDWLQVRLPDGQDGWMLAELVVASSSAANAPVIGTAETATDVLTGTAAITGTAALPAVDPGAALATPDAIGAPTGATATVSNPLGANFRSAPSRDLEPVYSAAAAESFAVIGRNGTSQWVQLVLPDGSAAWALASTMNVSVAIDTLPVTQP
jgi:uncharacterized protein YgiM (DUF1202 family)